MRKSVAKKIALFLTGVLTLVYGYLLLKQTYLYLGGTFTQATILELEERSVTEGSLPGVSGKASMSRGDLGGFNNVTFQDLTIEYIDPKLGRVQNRISARNTKFKKGDILEIQYIVGNLDYLELYENQFNRFLSYGLNLGIFNISIYFFILCWKSIIKR